MGRAQPSKKPIANPDDKKLVCADCGKSIERYEAFDLEDGGYDNQGRWRKTVCAQCWHERES